MLSFTPQTLLDLGINPLVVIAFVLVSIIVSLAVVKIVYSQKIYKCTECRKNFKPEFLKTHLGYYQELSADSEKGKEQYCPHCKRITWCLYDND